MSCLRKCPSDAIIGDKKTIHVIDQEKCTKCNTCFEVCPPRFRAVKKISGEPVPPPIPEECWDCKECFSLCPTSALQAAYGFTEALIASSPPFALEPEE